MWCVAAGVRPFCFFDISLAGWMQVDDDDNSSGSVSALLRALFCGDSGKEESQGRSQHQDVGGAKE